MSTASSSKVSSLDSASATASTKPLDDDLDLDLPEEDLAYVGGPAGLDVEDCVNVKNAKKKPSLFDNLPPAPDAAGSIRGAASPLGDGSTTHDTPSQEPAFPPPPAAATGVSGQPVPPPQQAEEDDDTGLSTQMIAAIVPTFFIPMDLVLAALPDGYTVGHIEALFGKMRAVTVVSLADSTFVKSHGADGYRIFVDTADPGAVQARLTHAKFKPTTEHIEHFVEMLPPGRWLGLFELISKSPAAVVQSLPYQGPPSLLYFAQLQHIFEFDPAAGRVRIPLDRPTHLSWDTTPVPVAMHAVFHIVKDAPFTAQQVWDVLSDEAQECLRDMFTVEMAVDKKKQEHFAKQAAASPQKPQTLPRDSQRHAATGRWGSKASTGSAPMSTGTDSMSANGEAASIGEEESKSAETSADPVNTGGNVKVDVVRTKEQQSYALDESLKRDLSTGALLVVRLVESHTPVFGFRPGTALVMLRSTASAEVRHSMSIEDQLALAEQQNDRRRIKTLRRKLLAARAPENPLLDKDKLAEVILGFLPPHTYISVFKLKESLPRDVVDYLPKKSLNFWLSRPDLWKVYQIKLSTVLLQRAELPPPDGALKNHDFSELELKQVVAEGLARGPCSVAQLQYCLPIGVAGEVKQKHGSMLRFVQSCPDIFAVVLASKEVDRNHSLVTLIKFPRE